MITFFYKFKVHLSARENIDNFQFRSDRKTKSFLENFKGKRNEMTIQDILKLNVKISGECRGSIKFKKKSFKDLVVFVSFRK